MSSCIVLVETTNIDFWQTVNIYLWYSHGQNHSHTATPRCSAGPIFFSHRISPFFPFSLSLLKIPLVLILHPSIYPFFCQNTGTTYTPINPNTSFIGRKCTLKNYRICITITPEMESEVFTVFRHLDIRMVVCVTNFSARKSTSRRNARIFIYLVSIDTVFAN